MHLYDDIAKEVYPDGRESSRFSYVLFFSLSFLFHLSMLLLIQQWARWEGPRIEPEDQVVQLIDPKTLAPPKPRSLLFGTDREEDLTSIPLGKETRLPPIPKSERPGLPPTAKAGKAPGASAPPRPKPELPPAPILPAPSPALPERPAESDGALPAPSVPSPPPLATEEVKKPLPSLPSGQGGQGAAGADSPARPGVPGLPGLPFADAKSLDRLAKVFSDQERVPPKDTISINTDDLKYFSYTLKLKNKIEYIWRYPQAAAERGIQGDLLLTFTIQRNGYVSEVRVVSTSGYEVLDLEAVRAIKEASPFAPLPDSWNEDHITITGHFIYHNQFTYLR
jgi:protein TonB